MRASEGGAGSCLDGHGGAAVGYSSSGGRDEVGGAVVIRAWAGRREYAMLRGRVALGEGGMGFLREAEREVARGGGAEARRGDFGAQNGGTQQKRAAGNPPVSSAK